MKEPFIMDRMGLLMLSAWRAEEAEGESGKRNNSLAGMYSMSGYYF